MTQSKTYVEHLPGKKISEKERQSFMFHLLLEPPGDLNEYLSARPANNPDAAEIVPVSAPPSALEETDQGGSSMITT